MSISQIKKINKLFKSLQTNGNSYQNQIGKGSRGLPPNFIDLFKNLIPKELVFFFPSAVYSIYPAFATGRVAGTPSISIINNTISKSPKKGVFLVFLFSPDLSKIYFQLAMGVSEIRNVQDIIRKRNQIRDNLSNSRFPLAKPINDQEIWNTEYKESVIYGNIWNVEDDDYCLNLLNQFKNLYDEYLKTMGNGSIVSTSISFSKSTDKESGLTLSKTTSCSFKAEGVIKAIKSTNLIYSEEIIKRYVYSLLTKPFVILSGLSGSGKTQLALSFALTMVENQEKQICFVPVGADWTNREPLLGYPNALKPGEYIKPESGVLSILMEAQTNPHKPYFLILDEMNLSYVERYFADFLSAMESKGMKINLWDNAKEKESEKKDYTHVPSKITLPRNLFITGTINVDETTYMFSPKVLDRANVIEFKISEKEMADFLSTSRNIDLSKCTGAEISMAENFVRIATEDVALSDEATDILLKLFKPLKKVNAEFGYRTSTEIRRFISLAKKDLGKIEKSLDAAIVQKLLPKLHGSRRKIVPVLKELWKLATEKDNLEVFSERDEDLSGIKYPLTADKILRMYKTAIDNGFTSFAEA